MIPRFVLLLAFAFTWSAHSLLAQDVAAPGATPEITANRAIDGIQESPLDAGELSEELKRDPDKLPVDRETYREFLRRLSIRPTLPETLKKELPRIVSTELTGDYRDRTIIGELAIRIEYGGSEPRFLRFEAWQFEVGKAKWQSAPETDVVWGVSPRGETLLRVARSDTLIVPIVLRGRTHGEEAIFAWKDLQSLSRRISITAAVDRKFSTDDGVFIGRTITPGGRQTSTWQCLPKDVFNLRCAERTPASEAGPIPLLKVVSTYELGPRGLRLIWEGRCDENSDLRKMRILVDAGITIVDVVVGENSVAWIAEQKLPDGRLPLTIELPDSADDLGNAIRIEAQAALTTDALFRLPRMSVPESIIRDESSRLICLAPYVVDQLELQDLSQNERERLVAPLKGEAFRFQSAGNSPGIQALVRWENPAGTWCGALNVSDREKKLLGVWNGRLKLDHGSTSVLEFAVDASWIVESVECSPAQYVRDWTKIEIGSGRTLYRLNLAKPLDSRDTLKLTWTARTSSSLDEFLLDARHLDFVVPQNFARARSYAAFAFSDDWELNFPGGSEPRSVDARDLPKPDQDLIANPARSKIYVWDGVVRGWQVRCLAKHPSTRVDVETRLVDCADGFSERYRLRFSAPVKLSTPLYAHFSERRSSDPGWSFSDDDGDRAIAARRIPEASHRALGFPDAGECWEISLPTEIRGDAFVRCERTTSSSERDEIPSLLRLSTTIEQRGVLRFYTTQDIRPGIVPGTLRIIPRETTADDRQGVELSAWEYGRSDSPTTRTIPRMLRKSERSSTIKPILWKGIFESACQTGIGTKHVLNLCLENPGLRAWSFRMPPGIRLESLAIDGVAHAWRADPRDDDRLLLELDPTCRYVVIRFGWTGPIGDDSWRLRVHPDCLLFDEPLLERTWTVWAQPDCVPFRDSDLQANRGMSVTTTPFGNLFATDAAPTLWWSKSVLDELVGAQARNRRDLERRLTRFHESLSARPAKDESSVFPETCRKVIANAWSSSFEIVESPPELWIDVPRLRALGVFPDAPAQQRMAPALVARLILVVMGDRYLLTTRDWFLERSELGNFESTTWIFQADESRDRTTIEEGSGGTYRSLADWNESETTGAENPWTILAKSFPIDLVQGRRPYVIADAAQISGVTFVERSIVRAWALSIFLAVLAISTAWLKLRAPLKLFTGGLVLAAIPLLPATIAVWGTAVLWGLGAGQILGWLRCRPWYARGNSPIARSKTSGLNPIASGAIVVACVVIGFVGEFGSTKNVPAQDFGISEPKVFVRVLLPVDAVGNAIGDVVYLNKEFRDLVLRDAADERRAAPEFLWESAVYRGVVLRNGTPERARSGTWNVQLRGHALAADRWAELAFDEREIALLPDGVTIDGKPAEWRWSLDRTRFLVRVPRAGIVQLALGFRPIARTERMNAGIDFRIPGCLANTFSVQAAPEITLGSSASGEWQWSPAERRLEGRSGPLETLTIEWNNPEVPAEETARAEIDVVQYLKLRPGLARMDVRLPIRVLSGQLRKLELTVDDRLRLLATNGEGATPWRAVQRGRTIEVDFTRPLIEKGMLEIPFLVQEFNGSGTVTWPRCEVLGQNVKNLYFLGQVDDRLAWEEAAARGAMVALDRREIPRIWGEDAGRLEFAYRVLNANPNWKLQARQREPTIQPTAARAWIGVSGEQATWGVDQDMTVGNGSVLRIRGLAVEGWIPTRIVALQQSREIPTRWGLGKNRELTIFFETPVEGEVRLIATGTRTIAANAQKTPWNFPKWDGKPAQNVTLALEHEPQTLLRAELTRNFRAVPRAEWSELFVGWANERTIERAVSPTPRIVGEVLRGTPLDLPLLLKIAPNRIEGRIQSITKLESQAGAWWANVELTGEVRQGEIDLLEFRVAEQCREIVSEDQTDLLELQRSAPDGWNRLRFRPSRPLLGKWSLRFRTRLEPHTESPRWSPIRPLSGLVLSETLILPATMSPGQPLWNLKGYRAVEHSVSSEMSYRADQPDAEAVLNVLSGDSGKPRVALATHTLEHERCGLIGIGEFDLIPAGNPMIDVALPIGAECFFARIEDFDIEAALVENSHADGVIAKPDSDAPRGEILRFQLPQRALPQRLTIAYRIPAEQFDPTVEADLPQILGWPVTHSLAKSRSRNASVAEPDAMLPARWELRRASELLTTISAAGRDVWSESDVEHEDWRAIWRTRWAATRERLNVLRAVEISRLSNDAETPRPLPIETAIARLQVRWSELAGERIGARTIPATPVEIWTGDSSDASNTLYREVPGRLRSLPIPRDELPQSDWRRAVFLFAAGLLSTTLIVLTAARTGWGNLLGKYPSVGLLLASAIWWIAFEPREFAVLLLILSGLLWIVRLRERSRLHSTDFTLIADGP